MMDREHLPQDASQPELVEALLILEKGDSLRSERLVLDLIAAARSDVDRYFPCLYYGEILSKQERWDDARATLLQSAEIALNCRNDLWLALSHEKLGELSAAEENWFGALHHYRYALRKAGAILPGPVAERLQVKATTAQDTLHTTVISEDQSIIPLGKEYSSGNMLISFVHRDIFMKSYFARCLECNFCHDWCCSFGADIDIRNVERIQQHREGILKFVRPPEGEWFETEYSYFEEYEGNQYTRIHPQGSRCAFISKDQRGCGLHRYAISKGMDYHEIKPLVCILFPLSFEEGILSVAPELGDNSLVCAGLGTSVYDSLRNELEFYFGREFVQELDDVKKEVLRKD